jgi:hypothetical protein
VKPIETSVRDLLIQQFELETRDRATDDDLFQELADRVAYMLSNQMESFMSMMYRLDVPESEVRAALSPDNPEPPNITLAKLIIDRQVQRMHTKKTYRQKPLKDWLDF